MVRLSTSGDGVNVALSFVLMRTVSMAVVIVSVALLSSLLWRRRRGRTVSPIGLNNVVCMLKVSSVVVSVVADLVMSVVMVSVVTVILMVPS